MPKLPKAFAIESNIPVPLTATGASHRWPFAEMKIGDSFFVPLETAGAIGQIVRPAASVWARRHAGFKFTIRKMDGGYRIWRIEPNESE